MKYFESNHFIKQFFLFLFLFPFGGNILFSQNDNYYIRHFDLKDGLYNNHVRSIAQDTNGFLWIAQWDGLSRFDGYEFRNYFHEPSDTNSIPDIDLQKVCVDKYNNVWIFAERSFCKYNRVNDDFIQCNDQSVLCKTKSSFFSSIALDNDNNLWVFGNKGFEAWTANTKFSHYYLEDIRGNNILCDTAFHIIFDSRNILWLYVGHKLYRCSRPVDKANGEHSIRIEKKFYFNYEEYSFLNFDYKLFQLRYNHDKSKLWICTNFGLFYLDSYNNSITKADGIFTSNEFSKVDTPVMWSSKDKGLVLYSSIDNRTDNIWIKEMGTLETFFVDNQKIIWAGGMLDSDEGAGLFMFVKTGNFFKYYLDNTNERLKYAVLGLYEDHMKNIWVGMLNDTRIFKIQPDGSILTLKSKSSENYTISFPLSFLDDKKGDLWIACYGSSIYKYNYKSNQLNEFNQKVTTTNDSSFLPFGYKALRMDRSGYIYGGGGNTYSCFNPITNKVLFCGTTVPGGVSTLYIDKNLNYWFGGKNKLTMIEKDTYKKDTFRFEKITNIESIIEGDSSELWLAFLGQGIGRFDLKTKKITNFYSSHDGLSNNTTYNILKDNNGKLWISSNKGISMFNPRERQFWNFGPEDGLKIVEFNSKAAVRCEDGQLLFGGMGGVVGFYPDSLKKVISNDTIPILFIELRVSGDIIPFKDLYQHKKIELNKGSDNFEITFACPDFKNAEKIHYRYYLKELNNDTIYRDYKNRKANYTKLDPGIYTLVVEATDYEGKWTRSGMLEIIVPARLDQETWFRVLIIFIVITVITVIIRLGYRNIKVAGQKKQEQLKMEILRNQLNPHFIDNCLNSVNNLVSSNNEIKVNQYLSDFSLLMRLSLNNSNNEFIPFNDELESIRKYLQLETINNSGKFEYVIVIDESINTDSIEVTPSMVQPFVENAIKHAFTDQNNKMGLITIEFSRNSKNSLKCTVTDNGIGREQSLKNKTELQIKRKSKGEFIVRERLTLFNAVNKTNYKIKISDLNKISDESGTKVIVEIPLKKTKGD